MTFVKYPKLTAQQKNLLPAGVWTVQEKLDGANAGIELQQHEGMTWLVVHSRNVALAVINVIGASLAKVEHLTAELGAFAPFVKLVEDNASLIAGVMGDFGVQHLYGEWLTPHTIKYPADQYGKFYVFDQVVAGRFARPESTLMSALAVTGSIRNVPSVEIEAADQLTQTKIDALVERIQELAHIEGRPRIEGIVLKRYDKDALGELDQYGQRMCYKHVLPEFREDHANNSMFPAPKAPLTTEQRLSGYLPDRSIEKVYLKVVASNGRWENRLIPQLLGLVWQEFLEEHLAGALQKEKYPVVNMRELKSMLDARAREFALAYVPQAA